MFLSFKIALIVLLAHHCQLRFTFCAVITLLFATIRFTLVLIPSMCLHIQTLTLNLLTTTIVAPPSNACKWQMGFNSAFKGLIFCWKCLYFDFAQG